MKDSESRDNKMGPDPPSRYHLLRWLRSFFPAEYDLGLTHRSLSPCIRHLADGQG